ncbi:MAG: UDP-N-acetylmuramate--L-alanine ligase, partial [Oscillospiraceae bacterium]|nr:UDP-N-acetylmuramate--L-alanine ligase [Oscillospiraceae bacterium]
EDHLDYFKNLDNIIKSFHKFSEMATKALIINGDDENTLKAIEGITGKEIISFGLDPKNDFYAKDVKKISGMETRYTLMHKGSELGEITLHVAGVHNVMNSLAAAASAVYAGVDFENIAKGLSDFRGAGRRFEHIGTAKGITIVDDYAHHPTELSVTLSAAMEMGYNKVWAVFQPFTFSRTAILLDEFADALSIPDIAVLTDIMGSREKNTYDIYTEDLANKLSNAVFFKQDKTAEYTDERKYRNFDDVCDYICENAKDGDLVITLGCGDVYKVAKMIYKKLQG